MGEYSLNQFLEDCKSVGWYSSKVPPAWMDEMDVMVCKEDLEDVLMYKENDNSVPIIMDYSEGGFGEGVHFRISDLGTGSVTNTNDLITFLKVIGCNKGKIPIDSSKWKKRNS